MRRSAWLVLAATVVFGGCSSGAAGGTSSVDGGSCVAGSEGCACYPNDTCNATLTCASHLCVSLGKGGVGQGGMPASGGNPVALTGGTLGYGGFLAAAGGSLVIGTGGGGNLATGGSTGLPGFQVLDAGYVVAGAWHGYAWTAAVTSAASGAATTTMEPRDFSAVAAGATELCASGSVGQSSDYGGAALLGVNVNQAELTTDGGYLPGQTISISDTGIMVKYSNAGSSVLRVQIQTPAGESSPTGRWCAVLSGTGGAETVPWTQFWGGAADPTQGCWNSAGSHPPIGTQITQIALLVPGGATAAMPFSFCLQGLAQAA
jgi:hypothetical protein